jgi:uncharacterized membrane-anchored protein
MLLGVRIRRSVAIPSEYAGHLFFWVQDARMESVKKIRTVFMEGCLWAAILPTNEGSAKLLHLFFIDKVIKLFNFADTDR